jgi:hypothetical protein
MLGLIPTPASNDHRDSVLWARTSAALATEMAIRKTGMTLLRLNMQTSFNSTADERLAR